MTPPTQTLPSSWDDLCYFNNPQAAVGKVDKEQIDLLKKNPPRLLFSAARLLCHLGPTDESFRKFLTVGWDDIVDIIHDHALRNKAMTHSQNGDSTLSKELEAEAGSTFGAHLLRRHNQLPCTLDTTQRRVEEAKLFCSPSDPVLMLGDDDCVGLALARAGFKDVTSLDIDPKICHVLKERARKEDLPLRVFVHDLRQAPPPELVRNYRLVFMDPMYTISGIRLFLEGALKFTQHSPDTIYFMSLHLMSLMRRGIPRLPGLIEELGLGVAECKSAFNSYPIPLMMKVLLRFFNQNFMKTSVLSEQGYIFPFFLSDALVLRKKERTGDFDHVKRDDQSNAHH